MISDFCRSYPDAVYLALLYHNCTISPKKGVITDSNSKGIMNYSLDWKERHGTCLKNREIQWLIKDFSFSQFWAGVCCLEFHLILIFLKLFLFLSLSDCLATFLSVSISISLFNNVCLTLCVFLCVLLIGGVIQGCFWKFLMRLRNLGVYWMLKRIEKKLGIHLLRKNNPFSIKNEVSDRRKSQKSQKSRKSPRYRPLVIVTRTLKNICFWHRWCIFALLLPLMSIIRLSM